MSKSKKRLKFIDYYIIITVVLLVIVLLYCFISSNKKEEKYYANLNNNSPAGGTYIVKDDYLSDDNDDKGNVNDNEESSNKPSSGSLGGDLDYDKVKGEVVNFEVEGDSTVTIKLGEEYIDKGFKAYSEKYGDLKEYVTVENNVNTDVAGTYKVKYFINYKTFKHEIYRTVIVKDNVVAHLLGDKEVNLVVGSTYNDPGVNVTNIKNEDISNQCDIKTSSNVDYNKVGKYKITYVVTYNGNSVTINRDINVYKVDYDITYKNDLTNSNLYINFETKSEYYSHVKYLNHETKSKSFHFYAPNNMNITFYVYDIYGRYTTRTIDIQNIDKELPKGSCSGYYKNGSSYVSVSSSDNVGVSHYELNGKKYTTDSLIIGKEYSKFSILVFDKAGNKNTISCNLENKNALKGELAWKNSNGYNYWINVPEGASTGSPLLVFLHGDGEVGSKSGTRNTVYFNKAIEYSKGSTKFITIAPNTTVRDWSSSNLQKNLKGLIDEVVKTYKVDKNRIYIMGFSRGAIGTWGMISNYPGFFAAAVPVSCCAPGYFKAANAAKTPVYAFYGSSESYASCMSSAVSNINSNGGNAKKTVMNATHSTITGKLNYDEIYGWMLKQKK